LGRNQLIKDKDPKLNGGRGNKMRKLKKNSEKRRMDRQEELEKERDFEEEPEEERRDREEEVEEKY
jgi:hypothetical protein